MNARPSGKTARTLQWCRRHPARALRMLFWVWLVIGGTYLAKHLRRERIANLQKTEAVRVRMPPVTGLEGKR
jgi:hypothetical protein